jgi:hypothetical protein
MEMQAQSAKESAASRAWAILLALALFLLFFVFLLLAAQGKPFWQDESNSQTGYTMQTIWSALRYGSNNEASKSPLPHITDRLLFIALDFRPHQTFDLRFILRVLPAFYWSAANTFLFFFLRRRLANALKVSSYHALLLAAGGAVFCYSNSFCAYYAIESRPFSLWVSLSLLQFLSLWALLENFHSRRAQASFLLLNALLSLTTYASCFQVGIVCLLLQLSETLETRRWRWWGVRQKLILASLASSAFLDWFYMHAKKLEFAPADLALYASSLLEVMLKTFHHHGPQPAWVTFPLFFIFAPCFWWKRDRRIFLGCLGAWLFVASTFALYLGSLKGGSLFASRYVIYIVPSLTFLYLAGLVALLMTIGKWIERIVHRNSFLALLSIWCLAQVGGTAWKSGKSIAQDIPRFHARNTIRKSELPRCVHPALEGSAIQLEELNDLCRGIDRP